MPDDKLTRRRIAQENEREQLLQQRERGMLNAPKVTNDRYKPISTPKVFPEMRKRIQKATTEKVTIIYQNNTTLMTLIIVLLIAVIILMCLIIAILVK